MLVSHCRFLSLVYHDLFAYPLTASELEFWQIGTTDNPKHIVARSGPFYFLPNRREILLKRASLKSSSEEKYKIAQKAAKILSSVPTVKFIGMTGSLSMGGAKEEEDIDLLIVTSVGTLWITRLVSLFLLNFKGLKIRRFGDKHFKNKLCLNMWLDEQSLNFVDRKEIYTAHELLQIKPLFNCSGVYHKLLTSNKWVRQFFPNAFKKCIVHSAQYSGNRKGQGVWIKVLRILETPARIAQIFHMSTKRTREIVDNSHALLHPVAWNEYVPQIFIARLEQLSKGRANARAAVQVPD